MSDVKNEVIISECPVLNVVVYKDRAEVTREIALQLEVGTQEVVLTKLSKSLDKDSVRVDGVGPASIVEVSFQEISITAEEEAQESNNPEVTQLKEEKNLIEVTISGLQMEKRRIEKQQTMLQSYSESITDSHKSNAAVQLGQLLQKETIDDMMSFVDRFGEESFSIMEKLHSIDKDVKEQEEKIKMIDLKLSDLEPSTKKKSEGKDTPKQQVIGILLEVKESAEVKLLFSYLVHDAGWTPKYDLRVSSIDKKMEVGYFGLIQQNTGEDWNATNVSLSTATPSVGGTVPELDTCKLTFKAPDLRLESFSMPKSGLNFRSGSMRKRRSRHSYRSESDEDLPAMQQPQAEVAEGLSTTTFEIANQATIPSDNASHKVSVGTVELSPHFEYETVPKLAPHAFLKATVKNDSKYSFLAGAANVFLDQTFVTDTTLDAVSPGEEFSVSLGVDPRIKVTYKPLERYREQSGILSKTISYTMKQLTVIKNTLTERAIITLTDHVPRSQEEKLKVTLIHPVIPKKQTTGPPPNPRLNNHNNVVWKLEIAGGKEHTITIHYQIEYPAGETVEGLGNL